MKSLGDPPYICLITSGDANPSNFESEKLRILETLRDAVADGVNVVQIREKALTARYLFELVRDAIDILKGTGSVLTVNDRVDVAIAAGADGVHLPESSFSPLVLRRVFDRSLLIGVSTHSVEQAERAAGSGVDYIFFGPVFPSPGKGDGVGTGALGEVCRAVPRFPVIALGGVNETNVNSVLAAGTAGVAAIRSLNEKESRRVLCRAINATRRPPR